MGFGGDVLVVGRFQVDRDAEGGVGSAVEDPVGGGDYPFDTICYPYHEYAVFGGAGAGEDFGGIGIDPRTALDNENAGACERAATGPAKARSRCTKSSPKTRRRFKDEKSVIFWGRDMSAALQC